MYTPTIHPRFWLLGALALALSALMGTTLLAGSGAAPAGEKGETGGLLPGRCEVVATVG